MSVSRLKGYNEKLQYLKLYTSNTVSDVSIYCAKVSQIKKDTVEKLLSKGLDEAAIVDRLINDIGANTEDAILKDIFEDKFKYLIQSAKVSLAQEKQDKDGNSDKETLTLIENTAENWKLDDTAEIFAENSTKEDFIDNFNELNLATTEDNYFSQYINSINEMGADNFFDIIDSNKDGLFNLDELEAFYNSDKDDTSISVDEFNSILNKFSQNPTTETEIPELQANDTDSETSPFDSSEPTNTTEESSNVSPSSSSGTSGNYDSGSYDSSSSSSSTPSSTVSEDTQPKETVQELVKQKQQIIDETNTKVKEINTQIDTLIESSSISDELKTNYKTTKEAYDTNQQSISDNNTKILEYDLNLHDIARSVTSLEAEKSNLDTNTKDSDINSKNTTRKSEIEAKIAELQAQKTQIEVDKAALEQKNTELNTEEVTLKENLDTALTAVENALPPEIKTQIETLKQSIQTLESDRDAKVAELDAKITTLKAQEIEESKSNGEATGKLSSNPVGAKIAETALKYNGTKGGALFSTGNYGWCADFVTYVVKEVAMAMGMSKEAARKMASDHLGASPQKLANKNKSSVIETSGKSASELAKLIQPGMAFICKGSGASGQHTGFIAEVYDDGTFLSIEGNHGNKVCQVKRNIKDMYRFVNFTQLLV